MVNLKDIKKRINNIGVIEKITNSMKAISTARLGVIKNLLNNSKDYYQSSAKTFGFMFNLYTNVKMPQSVLYSFLSSHKSKYVKPLIVFIASDKGLCGGYNVNVFKELKKQILGLSEYYVLPIGIKASSFAKKLPKDNVISLGVSSDIKKFSSDDVAIVSKAIIERINSQSIDGVKIVSTENISILEQKVFVEDAIELLNNLALQSQEKKDEQTPYVATDFKGLENSIECFFNNYLSYLLNKKLTLGFLSEYSARLNAMDGANENCRELQKDLKLQYNRTRQGLITKELIEIISGSESV